MLSKKTRLFIYAIFAVIAVFILTIGYKLIIMFLRPAPEVAMVKYFEEKYDENVTCQKTSFIDPGYLVVGGGTRGEFISNKHPGLMFDCSAYSDEGKLTYHFYEDYQLNFYKAELQRMMQETADKYFEGEYYVVAQVVRKDADDIAIMPFEECVKRYDVYHITVYVFDMSDEEACDAMNKFVADVENQGFEYSFYLGSHIDYDRKAFRESVYDKDFTPWYSHLEWIYRKWLPNEEGEREPEIYCITEDPLRE